MLGYLQPKKHITSRIQDTRPIVKIVEIKLTANGEVFYWAYEITFMKNGLFFSVNVKYALFINVRPK